uniref:Uncharacterized protein n=1 Tax=Mola mola TaxID=94237 RepID=A0A3Q3XPY6_MOLML
MSAQEEMANTGKVLSFLREWDHGNGRVLSSFLVQNAGKTSYELERQFAQAASLFLAFTGSN